MSADAVAVRGEAAEVALGEAQAVLAHVADGERRGRLADLIAAVQDGEVAGDDAEALEEILELGLQTGRLRAVYGPGGEQAALRLYRKLPRGQELGSSTRAVSEAVAALEGCRLERVALQSVGPGAFLLTLAAGGRELSLRLDRQGARIASASA
jgi:hypothetical protein